MSIRIALLLFLTLAFRLAAQTPVLSTYLRAGFTPAAIATDAAGNVYIAGNETVDQATSRSGILIVRLDPQGATYLYERHIAASGGETVSGMAVDPSGNVYIAGTTQSRDFPITPGTPANSAGPQDPRTFVMRFDSAGATSFAVVLGGTVKNTSGAIALTPRGEAIVSGLATATGFPTTPGTFSVPDSAGRPFLVKLDLFGQPVFSATGVGGKIALDSAGNIYVAGNTLLLDYPTTPGAYQTKFVSAFVCFGMCRTLFPAPNQYVTKLDPAATRLIYSTGVSNQSGGSNGGTFNNGIAVDSAGNVYLSGIGGIGYPFTTPPLNDQAMPPFLTKLDPQGQSLIYSIPGAGGQPVIAGGDVYVGGVFQQSPPGFILLPVPSLVLPPGLVAPPAACLPNLQTSVSQAFVTRFDASSGAAKATALLDGSAVSSPSLAFGSKGRLWIAGTTGLPDIPFIDGALAPPGIAPGVRGGAYLAAFDSFTAAANGPSAGCIMDSATLIRVGPIAPLELLTIFGSALGPDNVAVSFDGVAAKVLYASAAQVNVAVPVDVARQSFTTMQVSVNGTTLPPRRFPVTIANPNLFVSAPAAGCQLPGPPPLRVAVARNEDGGFNTCTHPAQAESIVSFYVNGVGIEQPAVPNQPILPPSPQTIAADAFIGSASAEVVRVVKDNDFVWRIDVRVPQAAVSESFDGTTRVIFRMRGAPAGPVVLPGVAGNAPAFASEPLVLYVPSPRGG